MVVIDENGELVEWFLFKTKKEDEILIYDRLLSIRNSVLESFSEYAPSMIAIETCAFAR